MNVISHLPSAQAVIGVLVVIGCFIIVGIYVVTGRQPDGYIIAIVSAGISGVSSFYFGHTNGTTSALAVAATALANRTNPTTPDPLLTLGAVK